MSRRVAVHASRVALMLLSLLGAQRLEAMDITITAEYRGGGAMEWVHTTPPAPNCIVVPGLCRGAISVAVPVSYRKHVVTSSTDPRSNFYGTLPASRQFQLIHDQSGDTRQAGLSFHNYSQAVDYQDPGRNPANTEYRMGGNCGVQNPKPQTATKILTHWRYSYFPGLCYTRAAYWDQPATVDVSDLALTYKLELPPAYFLKAGRYRGTVTYSLGAGGDFDFGDNVTGLNDQTATFTVILDVKHEFRVDFDAGFEHATLEPPGGWDAWLDGSRIPPRIYSDKSWQLTSTGPFRVYKFCEFESGEHCGIRNRRGQQVPLQVLITMPYSVRHDGWQSVKRWQLPTGRAAGLELQSVLQTLNEPGQLHFEVVEADLPPMFVNANERYSGQVTLVFDAEL